MHRLQAIRKAYGLSVSELAKKSGLSEGTIYRIESDKSVYGVHRATATALASALHADTMDLFEPFDVSGRGRPPHTGGQYEKGEPKRISVCPNCHLQLARADYCVECETPTSKTA